LFLFVDDFLQYWYHRFAHQNKFLWKWHISHHAAEEMGLLVSYRNAFGYYLTMPNIYWLGIFTFLGGGSAVAIGIVLKQLVIISSHSLITWDSFFHKNKTFLPILKIIERIFITPAFHHAHHAKSMIDGVGNPEGNFGNMFSIWDQLFGTAKFSHAFPADYGLQNDPKDSWTSYLFYPILKSTKEGSELSKSYIFEQTTRLEPSILSLEVGDYLYCKCGFSKNQPFCDGSHHGTKFKPEKFSIKRDGDYKLCNCKLNKKGVFCDNSHLG
jgi:CDGSH-type Zn-finger protein